MKTIEILDENENVINTVLASEEYAEAMYPGHWRVVETPEPPAPEAPVWEWYIDIGPFFDRFGAAKMPVLTSADIGVQAILKDTQVRKWLDLRLPEIEQSVQYIASKVPELTVQLQDQIVNTKPAEHENLALRKMYFS
jgi:hypothetical protein